ncbi:MAG: serine/threonine protein kinase [Deltaproteobacteria bacterium]|nr:MAG: serine/threonine protein kinase [Deltaproteobacteria bacterium]
MPSLVGDTVDKYDVLEEVGHGGMAVVYRARDRVLERDVALKVLHPHLADRPESKARLRREALAVAKLRHDNILEIYDYSGEDATEAYLVTEFIHGPTLRAWLDAGHPLRPAVAALLVYRLAKAVAHAHRFGIVHRDIKPENVMVRAEDGCLKLMDFGIAQILDHQKLTMTGQLLGSPAYMAPELISGRPIDARTDIFSLGILLYQLATSSLPFAGRNPHEVLTRIADGNYPPPSQKNPQVDPDLEAIIAHALEVDPAHRYQTADALAADLRAYLDEAGIDADAEDLGAYFDAPDAYVTELDERIADHLTARAVAAADAGETSRAIKLLGRVLELRPDHPRARHLFDRLCHRRRMRSLVAKAAGLAAALALVAGLGTAAWRALATSGSPSTRTSPSSKGGTVPAKAAADDGEGVGAGPPGTPAAAVATGHTEDDSATSSAGHQAPEEAAAKVPRREVVRHIAAIRATCPIVLEGVSPSHARNLQIRVGDGPWTPVRGLKFRVPLAGRGPTPVRIRGARFGYSGSLDPAACRRGNVRLSVQPNPATLEFPDAPKDAVVTCIRCPEGIGRGPYTPDRFPVVRRVPPEGVTVELEYKHPEFRRRRDTFLLLPGPNRRDMNLRPL